MTYNTKYKSSYQIDIDLTQNPNQFETFIDNNDASACLFYKLNSTTIKNLVLNDCSGERFYNIFNNVTFNKLENLEVELFGNVDTLTTYMENLKKLTIIAHNTSQILWLTNTNFPSLEYLKIRGTTATISISTLKELDIDFVNTGENCDSIEKVCGPFGECQVVNGVYPNLETPVVDSVNLTNHNTTAYYLNGGRVPTFTNCPNLRLVSLISPTTLTTSSQIFTNCPNIEEVIIYKINFIALQRLYECAPHARIINLGSSSLSSVFPNLFVSNDVNDSLYINHELYQLMQQSEFTLDFNSLVSSSATPLYFQTLKPASQVTAHIRNLKNIPRYMFLDFWQDAHIILHGNIETIEATNMEFYNIEFANDCYIGDVKGAFYHNGVIRFPNITSVENLPAIIPIDNLTKFDVVIVDKEDTEESTIYRPTTVILNELATITGTAKDTDDNTYVLNEVDTGNAKLLSYNLGLAINLICRCENCVDFVGTAPNGFSATIYNNYYNYLRLKSLGLTVSFVGTIPERINTKYFNNSIINNTTNLTDLSTVNALNDSQGKLHMKLNSLNNLYELSEFITETGSSNTFLDASVTTLSGITNTTYNNRFSNLTKLSNLTTGGIEIGFNKNLQPYDIRNLKELTITGQELDCLNRSNIGNNETVPSTNLTRLKFLDTKKLRGRISVAECCSNLQELDLTGCENMDNPMSFLSECSNISDVWYNNTKSVIVGSNPSWKVNSSAKIHCSDFYLRHELFTNGKIWSGTSESAKLPLTSYIYDILNTNKLKEQANELILTQEFLAVYDPKGYINWDKIPYTSKKSIKRLYTGARKLDLYCFEALEYLESKTLEEIVITNNNLREIDLHGDVYLKKLSVHTTRDFRLNLDGCDKLINFNLNVGNINNFDIKSDYLTNFGLLVSTPTNYNNVVHVYLTSNRFGKEDDEICINSNIKIHYSGPQKNFENLKYKLDLNLDFGNNILPDVLTNINNLAKTFYQRIATTEEDKTLIKTIKFNDIMTIQPLAFKDFSNLVNVDFGDIEYIQHNAFENCTSLKNITLNKVKVIGTDAFKGCMLDNVVIGNCCEIIKPYAFEQVNNLTICSGEITPESLGLVNHLELKYVIPYDILRNLRLYTTDLRCDWFDENVYDYFLEIANNYENYYTPDISDLFYYFNRFRQSEDDAISQVEKIDNGKYVDEYGITYCDTTITEDLHFTYSMNNLIWRNVFKYNSSYIRNNRTRYITFTKPIRRLIIYVEGTGDVFTLNSNQSKFLSVDYVYDQYRALHFSFVNNNFPLSKIISNKDVGDINVYIYQNSVEYLTTTLGKDYLLASQTVPSYPVKCSVWWFVPATKPKQLICITSTHNTTNYDHTIASDFYIYKRHSVSENTFVPGSYFNKRLKKFISDGYDDSAINLIEVVGQGYDWESVENLTTLVINDGPLIFNRMNNLTGNLFQNSRFINLIDFTDFDKTLNKTSIFEYAHLKGKTLKLKQNSLGSYGYQCAKMKNGKVICSNATSLPPNDFASDSINLSVRCQKIGSLTLECFRQIENAKINLPDTITETGDKTMYGLTNSIVKNVRIYTSSKKYNLQYLDNVLFEDLEELLTTSASIETFCGNERNYGPIFCPNVKRLSFNNARVFGRDDCLYSINGLYMPNVEVIDIGYNGQQNTFSNADNVYLPNIRLLKSRYNEPRVFSFMKNSFIRIHNISNIANTDHHLFMYTTDSYIEILNHVVNNGKKRLNYFWGGLSGIKNCEVHLEEFDEINGDYIFDTADNCNIYLKSTVSITGNYVWGNSSTGVKGHIQLIYVDTNTIETKTIYGYPN